MTVVTNSPQQTEAFAESFAKTLTAPVVVAFFGGLGVGKTAFTCGLARGLGCGAEVSSPTFAIVHDYGGTPPLFHFDMYRVQTWEDLETTGFFDAYDAGGILACEWSENIENALPERTVRVTIQKGETPTQRVITVEGEGINEDPCD